MQSAVGVTYGRKSSAAIFESGITFLGNVGGGEIRLKFLEIPSTNEVRKAGSYSERGTDADQQHFIDAIDWGECFGTGRAKANQLHDHFIDQCCHNPGDPAVQRCGLRAKFVPRVKLGTERGQQCTGGCAISRLFRHGGGQELLGKRGGIEWRVRSVGSEPARGQCQRIERSIGRKQS